MAYPAGPVQEQDEPQASDDEARLASPQKAASPSLT